MTPTRPRQQPRTPTGQQQQERSTCLRMRQTGTHEGELQRQLLHQANFATESDETGTGQLVSRDGTPTPLFSPMVDKVQHDAICGLINMHANEKAHELSKSLDPTGSPYKDWWPNMAALRSTAQWQNKLRALGMPEQQVEEADKEQIGNFLFQHFDSEGNYHQDPLQTLPQEN